LQGEARKEFEVLREEIVGCLALVEALIDFGEGEEIEEGVFEEGAYVERAALVRRYLIREGVLGHLLTIFTQQGDVRNI
jgi:hypothetical protein